MQEGFRDWLEKFKKFLEAVAEWVRRCIPKYEPAVWNDANGVQYNNNCYNYACDIKNGTYAQPGWASGIRLSRDDFYCDGAHGPVCDAAVADGLVTVGCDTGCGCRDCWHQVALAMWPGRDYHWYRLDRDGRWSHKVGTSPATNLDNSDNIITDPRTADRGNYTVFCGCYCVNKNRVSIDGPGRGHSTTTVEGISMKSQEYPITIRLLIFSGRPDPEWPLEEEAIPKLRTRVQTVLKEGRVDQVPTGRLGYRGFLVQNRAKIPDLPTEFIVFRGVLTEHPGPQAQHRPDTAGIEEFLLAEARRRGFGELLDAAGVT